MSSDHVWIRNSKLEELRNSQTRAYQAEQAAAEIKARAKKRERKIRSQYEESVTSLTSELNTISKQHDSDLRRVSNDFNSRIARQAAEFKEEFDRRRAENQRDIDTLKKAEQAARDKQARDVQEKIDRQRAENQRDIDTLKKAEQAARDKQARDAQRKVDEIKSQHASDLRRVSAEFKEKIDRQRAENQNDINALKKEEQAARDALDRDAQRREREIKSQLESDLRRVSAEFKEEIDRQRAENQDDINALGKRVYNDLGRIKTNIQDMDNRFRKNVDDFTSRFNELANKEANKQKYAQALLNQLDDMLAAVAALKPEKFNAGGLFGQLKEQLARGKESFRQGHYEAAIAQANVNLTEVAALQQRLAYQNSQFNALLSVVREAANVLRSNIDMLTDGKPVHNFEYNGQTITMPYDIDHWTNGHFNDFCRDFNGIERRLETAENDTSMGLEQLDEIQEQLKSWLQGEGYLHLLDEEGKQNQIRSIAVDVTTSHVYETLEEKGWRFVDSGRRDNDDRNPNTITYEDSAGNQVALIVSAGDDPMVTPIDYEVYANGEDNRDSPYQRSIKKGIEKIIDSLQGGNMERGKTEHRNDCHTITTPQAFFDKYAASVNREQAGARS